MWLSFRDNICSTVEAPANVSSVIAKKAMTVAEKAIKSLEGAGVFGVELFLLADGQVHNYFLLGAVEKYYFFRINWKNCILQNYREDFVQNNIVLLLHCSGFVERGGAKAS